MWNVIKLPFWEEKEHCVYFSACIYWWIFTGSSGLHTIASGLHTIAIQYVLCQHVGHVPSENISINEDWYETKCSYFINKKFLSLLFGRIKGRGNDSRLITCDLVHITWKIDQLRTVEFVTVSLLSHVTFELNGLVFLYYMFRYPIKKIVQKQTPRRCSTFLHICVQISYSVTSEWMFPSVGFLGNGLLFLKNTKLYEWFLWKIQFEKIKYWFSKQNECDDNK